VTLHPETDPRALPRWERQKAEVVEAIQQLEHELEEVKERQQKTPTHLAWGKLPEDAKFERLAPGRKRLLDTVKIIAYRAEPALVGVLREELSREDDARALVRDLFDRRQLHFPLATITLPVSFPPCRASFEATRASYPTGRIPALG
jgi:hypothetical protein